MEGGCLRISHFGAESCVAQKNPKKVILIEEGNDMGPSKYPQIHWTKDRS